MEDEMACELKKKEAKALRADKYLYFNARTVIFLHSSVRLICIHSSLLDVY